MTNKEIEVIKKLKELEKKDKLFFVKHKTREIEKLLNIKNNTLYFYLHKFNININKKKKRK